MFSFCLGFRDWDQWHLIRCLRSINRLRGPEDELIVCDLGSRPDAFARIDYVAREEGATMIRRPHDCWSRSLALNVAAAIARRPWLVLTDADMLFPSAWRPAAAGWASHQITPTLGLTRSRDVNAKATLTLADRVSLPPDTWLAEHSSEHPEVGQGAAMVAYRRWFHRVGGFDEFYRVWGAEDNDLVLRAEWDGVGAEWISGAVVYHQWHRRDWPTPEQTEQVAINREYLAARARAGGPIVRNDRP